MLPKLEITVDDNLIEALYKNKVHIDEIQLDHEPDENQQFILKGATSGKSALAVYKSPYLMLAKGIESSLQQIKGKDARQKLFISSLLDQNILLSCAIGKAGTGKSLLSVAFALNEYFKAGKNIILIKPTQFVGGKSQVLGILPGTLEEKFEAVMASYMVHFKALLGKDAQHFLYEMFENERLMYLPIETARGMSLKDSVIIVDEAQNCDLHTLKTLISRVESSSKMILLGDLGQVDTGVSYSETGLFKMLNSFAFRDSQATSVINLKGQYRSALADLMENVWNEVNNLDTYDDEK